jgi:PAS domain S-box-containing protein
VHTAAKLAPRPLNVLLVGSKEEDFFLIREILERSRHTLAADLDHAHSLAEARAMLPRKSYDLILFEYETGDAEALTFLAEFQQPGMSSPYILLTEHADEETVADIIEAGAWDCMAMSQLDGVHLLRAMRTTMVMRTLQHEQRTAEESLRKLSRAVEQSADMVMITDRKGIIEYVNPAFEVLTGYLRDEACGKTPTLLKSGEQGPEVYQKLWKTILDGNVYRGILVNRCKNGERLYVELSISPVRDAVGEITHFIANGRDLSERLRLEKQLLHSQKMDSIGRLAAGVAHDFNNLLTIITSYSELALDDVPARSGLEAKLQEILLAARRAAELTRQLLAFSRKQPQALRVVELNQVIAGVAKALQRLIGEDIELRFTPAQGLSRVRVDPGQIEQILLNLAANARDAMPQGGHLCIETSGVFLDEEYVHTKPASIPTGYYSVITVSDDGAGISANHLPHIFEPFYTTKAAGEGTGLGLATVYRIVKQSKGFIWVYSEAGMGTVFRIYLPGVAARAHSERLASARPESLPRGSETILLVEDESAVRHATAEFLSKLGYTVIAAQDGAEALALARSCARPIDLALTDVVMPNMSGGQLAGELAGLMPQTKLLFVSGYTGKTVLDHKVVDLEKRFLQKPFTLTQLSSKIREVLENGQRPAAAGLP